MEQYEKNEQSGKEELYVAVQNSSDNSYELQGLMDAKSELLSFLKMCGKTLEDIEALQIRAGWSGAKEILRQCTDNVPVGSSIDLIDFKYDPGWGLQELFGTIRFKDGTWAERWEYDGSERWELKERPMLPYQQKILSHVVERTGEILSKELWSPEYRIPQFVYSDSIPSELFEFPFSTEWHCVSTIETPEWTTLVKLSLSGEYEKLDDDQNHKNVIAEFDGSGKFMWFKYLSDRRKLMHWNSKSMVKSIWSVFHFPSLQNWPYSDKYMSRGQWIRNRAKVVKNTQKVPLALNMVLIDKDTIASIEELCDFSVDRWYDHRYEYRITFKDWTQQIFADAHTCRDMVEWINPDSSRDTKYANQKVRFLSQSENIHLVNRYHDSDLAHEGEVIPPLYILDMNGIQYVPYKKD